MQLKFPTYKRIILKNELVGGLSAMQQRTVRYAAADCPQHNLAVPPELPMHLDKLKTILRTVRDPVADCPWFTFANSPEPTTSLAEFRTLRQTVRSQLTNHLQFNSAKPIRDNNVSRLISNLTGGLSDTPLRTIRGSSTRNHQKHNASGQTLT